jgi:hypothetical protein
MNSKYYWNDSNFYGMSASLLVREKSNERYSSINDELSMTMRQLCACSLLNQYVQDIEFNVADDLCLSSRQFIVRACTIYISLRVK